MTKDRVSTHFDMHKMSVEELKKLAIDKGISQTAMLERLIRDAHGQSVVDQNILLARLDRQDELLDVISRQLDALGGVYVASLNYIFAGLPELKKESEEAKEAIKYGANMTEKVVETCRSKLRQTSLSFLRMIWGDPGVKESIK